MILKNQEKGKSLKAMPIEQLASMIKKQVIIEVRIISIIYSKNFFFGVCPTHQNENHFYLKFSVLDTTRTLKKNKIKKIESFYYGAIFLKNNSPKIGETFFIFFENGILIMPLIKLRK